MAEMGKKATRESFGEAVTELAAEYPDVVVLDEPFTNLDQESIDRLSDYIVSLKTKKSIIAIMHSPEWDQFADVILRIENEKIWIEQ